jgi:hypothetical protein
MSPAFYTAASWFGCLYLPGAELAYVLFDGRVGHGLERVIKEIGEEFAGQAFPSAEWLVLRDETGEVLGVAGAEGQLPATPPVRLPPTDAQGSAAQLRPGQCGSDDPDPTAAGLPLH